jgi:hypothetical protein
MAAAAEAESEVQELLELEVPVLAEVVERIHQEILRLQILVAVEVERVPLAEQ